MSFVFITKFILTNCHSPKIVFGFFHKTHVLLNSNLTNTRYCFPRFLGFPIFRLMVTGGVGGDGRLPVYPCFGTLAHALHTPGTY